MKFPSPIPILLLASAAIVLGALMWWRREDLEPERKAMVAGATGSSTQTGTFVRAAPNPTAAPATNGAIRMGGQSGAMNLTRRLQAIFELPSQPERRQALEDLAGALARHDPEGARELLKSILVEKGEASTDAYAFVSGFSSDYAALDPKAAAEWAESLPLTLKFSAYGFVAQQWAKADLSAATAWAEKISDLNLRTSVLRRIGQELEGGGEPKVVAAWAQRLAGSTDAAQHTELVSRLWAKGDPQGAFTWSARIEDPARRTAAVVAIAGIVAERDPQAAGVWVGGFPAGELRTQAAIIASTTWANSNPEAAVLWIASLSDPQLLDVVTRSVARRWLEKDPSKATRWIQSAPISDQTRQYVLPGL